MGMLSGYAVAADKMDVYESFFRNIQTGKMITLLWKVLFERLMRKQLNAFTRADDCLDIPLCFPVSHIPLYSVKYYWLLGRHNPRWYKYMKAALNFPFLNFFPSVLNGRLAIDGGATDNIPLYPLLARHKEFVENGLDLIIVMHFDARYDYRADFVTDLPVLELDLGICNGFSKKHYDFSAEYVDEMINASYAYGRKICERLFGTDCSRESLQRVINEIFLEEHPLRQQNYSADRLVTILNKLGKFLRNDAHCHRDLFFSVDPDDKLRK